MTPSQPHDAFVISRSFDAPRELVWRVYTEREHLARWFGPKGFTLTASDLDFRPGGAFHYALRAPDGHEMWGKWIFLDIVAPERLVVIVAFSDAAGGITRHPMNPDWPRQTRGTTTFSEHAGKTTVTVRWEAWEADATEQRVFDESHDSMRMGWGGTFEQLADYLATLRG